MSEGEQRLGGVETELVEVKGRLGKVEGRLDSVEGRLGSVEHRLALVAEVQVRHGERLEEHSRMLEQIVAGDIPPFRILIAAVQEIAKNTAPLKDSMQRVADDHERRIQEREKRTAVGE